MPDSRPRFLGAGATAAALAVVVALGVLEARSRREMLASAGWVSHTLEVERELDLTRALLADAETGQRGYLLTKDASYLEPNAQATTALPSSLARLRELTADNPVQQQRIGVLALRAADRMDVLHETVAVANAGDRDRAVQMVSGGRGKALMTEIRGLIQAALGDEERLLQARQQQLGRSVARRGLEGQILIGAMAVGLLTVAFLLVHLNRVQRLMMICTSSRLVEHQGARLSFIEYLQRRFGVDVARGISRDDYTRLMTGTPETNPTSTV